MQWAEGTWPPLNRQKAAKAPRKQGTQLLSRTEGAQHGFTTAEMPETTPLPSPGSPQRTCLQMSSQNQPLQKHVPHRSSTRKALNRWAQRGSPENRNKTTDSHHKLSYLLFPSLQLSWAEGNRDGGTLHQGRQQGTLHPPGWHSSRR